MCNRGGLTPAPNLPRYVYSVYASACAFEMDWMCVSSIGVQVHDDDDDGGSATTAERRLVRSVVGWLRSVLGQGNDSGSSICLVLVLTGFLLTLFDPSIAIFSARPFVDGAAVSCSN